jgi:preprotein translocase subunit SecA
MPGLLPLEKFCEEERSKFLVLEHENVKVAIREYYCANPACPCTDVLLEFIALDEQNNAVKRLFTIRLDTRTWEVKEKPRHADKIIEEFTNRLGKGLKNRFLSHLIKAKEYGGKHYLDYVSEEHAKKILSGSMFDYQEIYGPKDSEKFLFDFDGERYLLVDQYCLNPKCPCNEVALIFIKLDRKKDAQKPSFGIRLNVNNHKYTVEESNCKSGEMAAVIGHVLENKPEILKLLKSRYHEMRVAGKEILKKYDQKEPAAKVGRNDPCPCGSGKKYKKCCGK